PPPVPRPQAIERAIERREAPPVGFGAPAAPGAAGTATPAEPQAQTQPAPAPSAPAQPAASRQDARPTPEAAAERHGPAVRQAPRRTERAQPEPAPRVFTPLPPETNLPPTRGFGDLPRPPGLVGAQ
ncbi:hypothetical protein K9U40_06025, partial [Xanthobacter autotrophicus]|nr:hypothetical protein [Xanthobacter autotrophicus]